jgi:hypothetical protein
MSGPIEQSTITIKTAVAVIVGLLSVAGSIAGSYWASYAATDKRLLELQFADEREALIRENKDEKLETKIDNNRKDIDVLMARVNEMAINPSTVTTYR